MRLILLTVLALFAFAADSVLNRMALVGDGTGPAAFALIRLASGAVFLFILASLQGGDVRGRVRTVVQRVATVGSIGGGGGATDRAGYRSGRRVRIFG